MFVGIWSISVFVFFRYNMDKSFNKIDSIAEYTLGIYGCHMFVVFGIWRTGIAALFFNGILGVPFIVALVFACALCFTFLLSKIPFIGKWVL